MGAAMALRLRDSGHDVTVWNRTRRKADEVIASGCAWAATPRALAEASDVVITMLTNAAAIDDVYHGAIGLLAANPIGKLLIEMSTVKPHVEEGLAAKVAAAGARFVECPVGGTVGPARNGQLLGMVGAAPDDYEAALPVLRLLCRRVERVGLPGAGASLKLAVNLPLLVYYQALAESYVLCRHLKLDPKWLIEFLSETSGAPNMLKGRGPAIATALAGGDVSPVTFDLDLVRKDLVTMIEEAQLRNARLPAVEAVLAIYDEAARDGWGSRDAAALPAFWPSKTGTA
jgi:3-hydroxyisobutyrate dehydrogenase